jgi:hypothetical protein
MDERLRMVQDTVTQPPPGVNARTGYRVTGLFIIEDYAVAGGFEY